MYGQSMFVVIPSDLYAHACYQTQIQLASTNSYIGIMGWFNSRRRKCVNKDAANVEAEGKNQKKKDTRMKTRKQKGARMVALPRTSTCPKMLM